MRSSMAAIGSDGEVCGCGEHEAQVRAELALGSRLIGRVGSRDVASGWVRAKGKSDGACAFPLDQAFVAWKCHPDPSASIHLTSRDGGNALGAQMGTARLLFCARVGASARWRRRRRDAGERLVVRERLR